MAPAAQRRAIDLAVLLNGTPAPQAASAVSLSAIVLVCSEVSDLAATHRAYRAAIEGIGGSYELIYVPDGHYPATLATLKALRQSDPLVIVLVVGGETGEAAALASGLRHARGAVSPPEPRRSPSHQSGFRAPGARDSRGRGV